MVLKLGIMDVNARYEFGNTMLHLCAKNSDSWAIKLLLSYEEDPNTRNDSSETPMFLIFSSKASINRKRECAEVLVLHGADYDKKNYNGDNIVDVAFKNNSVLSLQSIVAHIAWLRESGPVDETIVNQIKFVPIFAIKSFQDPSHMIFDKILCYLSRDDLYTLKNMEKEIPGRDITEEIN